MCLQPHDDIVQGSSWLHRCLEGPSEYAHAGGEHCLTLPSLLPQRKTAVGAAAFLAIEHADDSAGSTASLLDNPTQRQKTVLMPEHSPWDTSFFAKGKKRKKAGIAKARLTKQQAQVRLNQALQKVGPAAAAEGSSLGTLAGAKLDAVREASKVQPLVAKPEKDTGGQGQVGLASNNILWARQLALTAYKAKEAAVAVQKQANAAKVVADTAAVQVGYIMNHPCMRLKDEGHEEHNKAFDAALLRNETAKSQSELARTEAMATVTPKVASVLPTTSEHVLIVVDLVVCHVRQALHQFQARVAPESSRRMASCPSTTARVWRGPCFL